MRWGFLKQTAKRYCRLYKAQLYKSQQKANGIDQLGSVSFFSITLMPEVFCSCRNSLIFDSFSGGKVRKP